MKSFRFVELKLTDGQPLYIDPSHIVAIEPIDNEDKYIRLWTTAGGGPFRIAVEMEELLEKIFVAETYKQSIRLRG